MKNGQINWGAIMDGIRVKLGYDELVECLQFAKRSYMNHCSYSFNEFDHKRGKKEQIRDIFIGKVGEYAFAQWLCWKAESNFYPDFRIRSKHMCDEEDFRYRGWKFDVKCTVSGNCFRISRHSMEYRQSKDQVPHYYVMVKTDSDIISLFKQDEVKEEDLPRQELVYLVGFISSRSIPFDPEAKYVKKGEEDPDTGLPSISDFYEVKMNDLNPNFDILWWDVGYDKPYHATFSKPELPKRDDLSLAEESKDDATSSNVADNKVGQKPDEDQELKPNPKPLYSILVSGYEGRDYSTSLVEHFLSEGIKVIIFTNPEQGSHLAGFLDCPFFELYEMNQGAHPLDNPICIVDGDLGHDPKEFDKVKKVLCNDYHRVYKNGVKGTRFNIEQYLVEHAPLDKPIIVKASAGTGKTSVMMDRIMFLFAVGGVKPEQLGMVTFTNEAANHMMQKLQAKVNGYYHYTKKIKYLEIMEQLAQMKMSTIDSFFKDIISREGALLGYSHNIQVRSFIQERNQIIHKVVNDVLSGLGKLEISSYTCEKLVRVVWETLSGRGYFPNTLEDIEMGTAGDPQNIRINEAIHLAVIKAREVYEERKKELDAIDIGDIKEDMDRLTSMEKPCLQELSLKYLMVDEFQDTDNSQIRCLAWLSKQLECQLFVVGDVKQSIYRFRGATDSAYEQLKKDLKTDPIEYTLRLNYRSDPQVLEELNRFFQGWDGLGCLDYKKSDEVENGLPENSSSYNNPVSIEHVGFNSTGLKSVDDQLINAIVRYQRDSDYKDSICILCRSNYEVTEIVDICRSQGITCHAKMEGGFYSTPPVNDLYALLGALLYPKDPVRLFNYLISSYAGPSILNEEWLTENAGDSKALISGFKLFAGSSEMRQVRKEMQVMPAFEFLRNYMVKWHDPIAGYFRNVVKPMDVDDDEKKYKLESYSLNLEKLFQILYDKFANDFVTLEGIYEFLSIRRTTGDTSEDAVYPEKESKGAVLVMTVHKAKGLEFDHVLLPYTSHPFHSGNSKVAKIEVLTEGDSCPVKVGWAYTKPANPGRYDRSGSSSKQNSNYHNNNFTEMHGKEMEAVRAEETRILYVALTRARKTVNAYITFPPNADINCWADLLDNNLLQ